MNDPASAPKVFSFRRPDSSNRGSKFFYAMIDEAFKYYVSGFVDGEGCFSVSFRRLRKLEVGIETRISFSLSQKISSRNYALLLQIRNLFGGGAIRRDRTGCYKYETRSVQHIKNKVVPFFQKYPLYTSKALDFDCFCEICSLICDKQHLKKAGLLRILELCKNMNPSGKRRYTLEYLLNFIENKDG